MSFQSPLQIAVYQRLSGFTGLPTVYDHVPQQADSGSNAPFPYIVIGDDTHLPFDTDDSSGAESTITVHTWSRSEGRIETKQIQDGIYEALHRHDLDVSGYNIVTMDFESSESFMDPDNETRHGVSSFRILLDE